MLVAGGGGVGEQWHDLRSGSGWGRRLALVAAGRAAARLGLAVGGIVAAQLELVVGRQGRADERLQWVPPLEPYHDSPAPPSEKFLDTPGLHLL